MTKVHPNASAALIPVVSCCERVVAAAEEAGEAVALTVWRRSLIFNGNGFTVFDSKGNLVYRVDNYACGNKGEIVLMDGAGIPLLTIRRKKLSLGDHWLIYDGESSSNPLYSVKKHANLLHPNSLAQVTPCGCAASASNAPRYEVEGSYSQRQCVVFDGKRRPVAEIRRKESCGGVAFGGDVFRLVVHPGVEAHVAMAIVILLDQMFGSRGSLIKS